MATPETMAKFWKHTEPGEDGCILWTGPTLQNGTCMFYGGSFTKMRAQRFVYCAIFGSLPSDLMVVPTCGQRRCVNPNHMALSTAGRNTMHGNTPPAVNARKKVCKNGHELTPENVYVRKDGKGRQCKACNRENVRRHKLRKKQAEVDANVHYEAGN